VGGVQVGRGYLGRAGLTAERFVPDENGKQEGGRLYRTGDRVRWTGEGKIEYLGRLDDQVKVRGFRIELGEIESVLGRSERVREARVIVREEEAGEKRLVAYVVGEAEGEELREYVRGLVPEYMVPGAFVRLEKLPLTANGKLDVRALPAPDYGAGAETYVTPETAVEQVLAEIWAGVLKLERVGVTDNFFEIGGHSLVAMRVVSRAREVFGVEVPVAALFETPTVRELGKRIEEMRRAGRPVLPAVKAGQRQGAVPLSYAQERLWFLDRLQPGSVSYNLPMALRLSGELDVAALEKAVGEIVRRHEALRTSFGEIDERPVQVIAAYEGLKLEVEQVSQEQVNGCVGEEAGRRFDLGRGPLFVPRLLRVGESEHVLVLSMHHVVSDGWSLGVLLRELTGLYGAYREGRESPLEELEVQYADYAIWQREQLRDEVLEQEVGYWKQRLEGAPGLLELPVDRARPAVRSERGARATKQLGVRLLERMRQVGREEGASLYMVLLGAFQALLSKYSGSEDVVVGSPIAGRTSREVEGLIGFFVNTLVMRTDLRGDPSVREVIGRVREAALGAYEHQAVPFEKLVAELQPERTLSHSPLFQVSFQLREADDASPQLPGLHLGLMGGGEVETTPFDLMLGITATESRFSAWMSYSTDLFEHKTIERMLEHLERVLEQVAANPDVKLSDLEPMSPAERKRILEEWNRTETEYPLKSRCIHQFFEVQVEERPEAVAVTFGSSSLSYGELNRRANRLAHYLIGLGVGPEVRVGLCLERSLEMVVALLAVLKAGGAYVPLDPDYPADRLVYMIGDSKPAVVLTQKHLRETGMLPECAGRPVLCVDSDERLWLQESPQNTFVDVHGENLAYVIYTSGSTGVPKGVMNAHNGVGNGLLWMKAAYALSESDRVVQKTPFSFDVSVWEFFTPLLVGARLVVARPGGQREGDYLSRLIEQERITTALFVPSVLEAFLQTPGLERCDGLKRVICSGEALPASLPERFWKRISSDLHNLYGPTEAAVEVTAWECVRERVGEDIPIGKPIANIAMYVLDRHLAPVPVGVAGELFIGGVGVARGYVNRPGWTAEKFMPDRFGRQTGQRMYRTGDLARYREDGNIEYLGRMDNQVKLRGARIELGEIEKTLETYEPIKQAVVTVRKESSGDQLVAYVVSGNGIRPSEEELLKYMKQRLPDYMVPPHIVMLEKLPQTPNGKVDRKMLPAPDYGAGAETYVAPETAVEQVLAEIWAGVLKLERVGVTDNFFEIGGHSLLATQIVSRVKEVLGFDLSLRSFFETPSIAELAAELSNAPEFAETMERLTAVMSQMREDPA
jgi:amino acid adenylation domain-containing protein